MTPPSDWILTVFACIPALLRMAWDLRLHAAWRTRQRPEATTEGQHGKAVDRSASLILCVHNDLEALQGLWPLWRQQWFPEGWEIEWVVVDDGSEDGTREWLQGQMEASGPHLTVIHHDKRHAGKKAALTAGITSARHDRLVLTDADCRPGRNWAWSMASRLGAGTGPPHVLVGFSLPHGGPAWAAFDALRVAWQYGGQAAAGAAYMGVGRNLAYRKSDWLAVGGFSRHADVTSGDDDLFVQDALRHGLKCAPVAPRGPDADCPTLPAASSLDAWRRKARHLSTARRYARPSLTTLAADAALDPLVALMGAAGGAGLLHIGGWIPLMAAGLALTVRSATLSSFARDLNQPLSVGIRAFWLGPVRWGLLGVATLSSFTSSPTWTQRAPTKRS